jgi:uncharacterized protein YjbJ (UPF0337 family)
MNTDTQKIKSGNQDKVEGTAKGFAGKVKEETGKIFHDPKLHAEGKAEQHEGQVQRKVGEIKKEVGR